MSEQKSPLHTNTAFKITELITEEAFDNLLQQLSKTVLYNHRSCLLYSSTDSIALESLKSIKENSNIQEIWVAQSPFYSKNIISKLFHSLIKRHHGLFQLSDTGSILELQNIPNSIIIFINRDGQEEILDKIRECEYSSEILGIIEKDSTFLYLEHIDDDYDAIVYTIAYGKDNPEIEQLLQMQQ